VALRITEPADDRPDSGLRSAFRKVTGFGFPQRFPIVQFPNLPLIVAFLAGWAGRFLVGTGHFYAASVSYLAMTIWAYEELAHGVNWFRRVLGLTFVILLIMRVAHAIQPVLQTGHDHIG
jgi:hypothetical protein